MSQRLVIGTRGSALALAQAEIVGAALRPLYPALEIRIECIRTTGDIKADVPLAELGRGIFVAELEQALRDGRIDVAVHSAKDLPSVLADDVRIAAYLRRADARDVLVSSRGTLATLPSGARVATSSPRRACQIHAARPDLVTCDVRGNVDTRLRKLAAGDFDALVLAAAGLQRLDRTSEITEWLEPTDMIPSVGQGALAIEVRAGDARSTGFIAALDHADTRAAVTAERACLAELGAGCRAAVGAHARIDGARLRMLAMIGETGGRFVRALRVGDAGAPEVLGLTVARELLVSGGADFLASGSTALAGKTIAITRADEQSAALAALFEAHGAIPIIAPTISIERTRDVGDVDAALREIGAEDWLVFSSANAVGAIAERLGATGARLPATVRVAAVGNATASALHVKLRAPDFIPSRASGLALARELPDVTGRTVWLPRSDLGTAELPEALRSRGARVREVIAYHTVPGPAIQQLVADIRDGSIDAAVFTSPSSLRAVACALTPRAFGRVPAVIVIGPTTASAARALGIEPDAEAATPSTGGIVEAALAALQRRQSAPLATQ